VHVGAGGRTGGMDAERQVPVVEENRGRAAAAPAGLRQKHKKEGDESRDYWEVK